MSEKDEKTSIPKAEIELIQKSLYGGAFHIALGYLSQLKSQTGDNRFTLEELHKQALAKLVPGDDYKGYLSMHTKAYNYLSENSELFGIEVKPS